MIKKTESKHLREYMKKAEKELLETIKKKPKVPEATLDAAVAEGLRKAFLYGQESALRNYEITTLQVNRGTKKDNKRK